MYCCVVKFRSPSGIGTILQTIPDIEDANTGTAFQAKFLYFLSGSIQANTLEDHQAIGNASDIEHGIWLEGVGSGIAALADLPQFGVKVVTTAGGSNRAHVNYEADAFFSGQLYRKLTVVAVNVGSVDVSWEIDVDYFITDNICLAIGGDDINFETVPQAYQTGTHATSTLLNAILTVPISAILDSGGVGGGTARSLQWGWSVRGGTEAVNVYYQTGTAGGGGNARAQLTDTFGAQINDPGGAVLVSGSNVSAWNDDSVEVTNGSTGISAPSAVGISGNTLFANGDFTVPATDGTVRIVLNHDPLLFILTSVGNVPSDVLDTALMQTVLGFAAGEQQMSFWTAEISVARPPALKGIGYLSDDTIARLASPDGVSTVFNTIGTATLNPSGWVDIEFTNVTGNEEQFIWFSIGAAVAPTVPTRGAGIYKLVPQKKQDTVWLDVEATDKALFKIPDPNAYTALIGDE